MNEELELLDRTETESGEARTSFPISEREEATNGEEEGREESLPEEEGQEGNAEEVDEEEEEELDDTDDEEEDEEDEEDV